MIPMRGAGRDYQLLEEERSNDWPHDNSYWNFCSQCGVQFAGPRRSSRCRRGSILIEVEPTEESGGHCDCCGHQTRTVWGYVHEDQGTVASYFMQWTVGASLETHPANFDLIYGRWGDGTSSSDRCAISLLHFENEHGPGVMVIDAKDRPITTSGLVSQALTREEIIGTDLATHVFAIFDAVITQDKRLT